MNNLPPWFQDLYVALAKITKGEWFAVQNKGILTHSNLKQDQGGHGQRHISAATAMGKLYMNVEQADALAKYLNAVPTLLMIVERTDKIVALVYECKRAYKAGDEQAELAAESKLDDELAAYDGAMARMPQRQRPELGENIIIHESIDSSDLKRIQSSGEEKS